MVLSKCFTPTGKEKGSGNTGLVVGIVVASLVIVALAVVVVFALCR